MNRLSSADRTRVIACLCEGNSIRATERITPAMAAGLTDHVWELSEIVALLEAEEMAVTA